MSSILDPTLAVGDFFQVNFRVERGIKGPKAVEVEVVDPWFGRKVFLDLKIDG